MKLTNHEALIENGKPRLWISEWRQATCRGPILIEGWNYLGNCICVDWRQVAALLD